MRTKPMIVSGLVSGTVYAALMAVFDYSEGQDFRIWRFIFNLLLFGILMGLMIRYNLKKQAEKENKPK